MADEIRVNGNQLSWGSIKLKLNGEDFSGFTAISYADKRERVKAYGMGRHHAPRGRSRGKYTIDPVKLTGWKSSVATFREELARISPTGLTYGDVEFQIVVMYSEANDGPIVVEINGCVWVGNTSSEEENPDPLKEEIEVDAMGIKRNGLVLYDSSEGAPI
jgi:hypothetical protein